MHRSLSFFFLVVLIITVKTSGHEEPIIFVDSQFSFEITDRTIDSSGYDVTITNSPELPHGASFKLIIEDSLGNQNSFSVSTSIDTGLNMVRAGNNLTLIVETETDSHLLHSHVIPKGVWNHLGHVYSNWTHGTVPDGRGFGQGAIRDVGHVLSLISDSPLDSAEASILGETVVNIVRGSSIDYNDDIVPSNPSDGYGLLKYSFGMRDHIFNAGDSPDASSMISERANVIVDEYENYIL
ncbi:MAG: hypothetical protein ACW99Q_30095 [Candidatus Kariarchaeaceae archaeon]